MSWDGEPLFSAATVAEGLFEVEAFEQIRGQLAIEPGSYASAHPTFVANYMDEAAAHIHAAAHANPTDVVRRLRLSPVGNTILVGARVPDMPVWRTDPADETRGSRVVRAHHRSGHA